MKKTFLTIIFASFLISCNMNPSKEARIQKLETEIQLVTDRVNELENKVQTLEDLNEELTARITDLEER